MIEELMVSITKVMVPMRRKIINYRLKIFKFVNFHLKSQNLSVHYSMKYCMAGWLHFAGPLFVCLQELRKSVSQRVSFYEIYVIYNFESLIGV